MRRIPPRSTWWTRRFSPRHSLSQQGYKQLPIHDEPRKIWATIWGARCFHGYNSGYNLPSSIGFREPMSCASILPLLLHRCCSCQPATGRTTSTILRRVQPQDNLAETRTSSCIMFAKLPPSTQATILVQAMLGQRRQGSTGNILLIPPPCLEQQNCVCQFHNIMPPPCTWRYQEEQFEGAPAEHSQARSCALKENDLLWKGEEKSAFIDIENARK